MTYTKIPEKEAVLLIRALGLLLSQAAVYGPRHNVTQSAARSVFAELEQTLKAFGPIEISLRNEQILINGSPDGITLAAGKNLADRMRLHKIDGLLFLTPADSREFLVCITLFGTPPLVLAAEGGFEGAIKKGALRSVRVVTVAYQRVSEEKPVSATRPAEQPAPVSVPVAPPVAVRLSPAKSPVLGVLDLSADLEDGSDGKGANSGLDEASGDGQNPTGQARKKQAADLAALLRDAAALLESGEGGSGQDLHPNVVNALGRIRGILSEMAVGSEHEISTLADQVDEDRQTIASIESAARRRGIGLKIMRAELVQRYAELNQEILQPLTVSSGVIDMLNSGCTGALTETQRELLKMAAESVSRVNQLVAYMNKISGLPDSLTPNAEIIRESYR
jgi:hypothetical protein